MALIPEGIIDDIQARADIVELISRYVPLKRAGRHFKANCPFHHEKTPSFMVNTEKQIFHCFGCGVGGNVFSFLMQHDRLTFPEAVRQLGEHVGVRVPDRETAPDATPATAATAALMEKVCAYFERLLSEPQAGKAARAYLKERGVSEPTRQMFRLGVSPVGWSGLLDTASARGVSAEQLEAAGLMIQGSSGSYDRFRSRLIFPIMDVRKRIVGFGGRSLDGREPKYLNSPETALYSKGRQLFGLTQAKDAIVQSKTAVVVEGYFDCVVLVDGGIVNVVSPLGTALTTDQVRLLKRYAEHVVLAFDADAAGEQATLRGIELLIEAGLQVRIAQLPAGLDPDEALRRHGRERFQQLLDQGVSIFDFLIQRALRRYPGCLRRGHAGLAEATEDTVRAAQMVLPTIARVPDAMLRSEYVRLLAERLALDEHAVVQELAKVQSRLSAGSSGRAATGGTEAGASPLSPLARSVTQGPERLLTALVLDDPSRWNREAHRLSLDAVSDPALRRILAMVCELEAAGQPATPASIISRVSEEGQAAVVAALVELAQATASKEDAFEDCVRRLRANTRKRELAALREHIRAAQEAGNASEAQRLLAEYQQHLSPVASRVQKPTGNLNATAAVS
ncbi:MAG: DNA primase [Candidatus Omnitrophica bacterium]|nr:DNA primase [Candidatus Omnitrophota bacterium]